MDIKYAYYNTSKGYRVLGGTAVHFLKADGSLDGTEYIDKTSFQDIIGTKRFYTSGGNNYDNNSLHIASSDGSDPAITFNKIGTIAGQLKMNVAGYHFLNPGLGYYPVNAAGYVKSGSNDSYVLLGGGGHMPVSSFNSSNYVDYIDNREISPSEISPLQLGYGFTAWDNNNTGPWADFLHFGSYTDASGGDQNLILFKKNGFGLRQYQGDWQSGSLYKAHVDYWHSGDFSQGNIDNWNTMFTNYVTTNTYQNLSARKVFAGATDNTYTGASIRIDGNGNSNTIFPTISFHQPTLYAGTLSYRGAGNGFHFTDISGNGYEKVNANGFLKAGSDDNYLLLGGGSHKPISDFATSAQLGNYLPLSGGTLTGGGRIDQFGNIVVQQNNNGGNATGMFWESIDNSQNIAGIGVFTDDGIFGQAYIGWGATPWSGATSLAVADNIFTYKNNQVYHAGNVDKFIFGSNWTGTTQAYSPEIGLPANSFKPSKSGFYRPNHENDYGGLLMWVNHPSTGGEYGAGIAFNYAGTEAYLTGVDGNGVKTPNKRIWTSGNFNPDDKVNKSGDTMTGNLTVPNLVLSSNYINSQTLNGSQILAALSDTMYVGNAAGLDYLVFQSKYELTHYMNGVAGTVWTTHNLPDYRNYGLGRTIQLEVADLNNLPNTGLYGINPSTLNAPFGYGTLIHQRFNPSEYTQIAIEASSGRIKTRAVYGGGVYDTGWVEYWGNHNFNPDSKVNKSGDTMTGNLNALTISAQNGSDKLIYDNIENYGSPLKINANASLGIQLQANGEGILYVGPSYAEFYRDVYISSGKVFSNYDTNSNQWGRAYTHGLVNRDEGFTSNIDANNLPNQTGIISLELGNGTGNTNFPKNDAYGNFLKISSRSFTTEFFHENGGNFYHRNWYLADNPGSYPFRKIWDDINLEDYHQYGLGKLYLESLADADTYSGRNTGFYSLNVSLHAPFQYGTVLKMMRDDSEGGEIAVSTLGANLAFREYVGGAYSQWYYTWHTGNFNPAQYVTQTSLNTQLANYATLNGIQTFTNTNTFSQSPVIPNGTLGTHAVNLNQLNDKADRNGSNASGEWLNASKALSINPYVPGRTFNASGASYLQDATYGDVNGFLNSNGIAQGNPTDNWYHRIKMLHSNSSGYFTEIGVQMTGGNSMWYKRYENGTDYGWVQVWDKENLSQANINNWNIAYGWGNHANAGYATGTWVNTNFIPKSHPVYNITQANINSWNAAASGSSHTHSNLSYLNNIDQWLGVGQAPRFNSVFLMDAFGYGQLVLGEGNIGGESGLVDISNKRFYAGRINEYLKYGSSIDGFEGLNIHFDEQLLGIGRELGNHEDKVQLAGDLSVDTIDINHNSRQLILNPLYNTDGDVRHSRNAHIYIVTRNAVTLPDKPILGQRIEIFNDSDSDIEVTHSNVGTMFKIPGFCKVTGIAANKGFRFDAEPFYTKQYDI